MCKLSKNWNFTRLSVTKTAKSDHPYIGRKIILFRIRFKDYTPDLIIGETE